MLTQYYKGSKALSILLLKYKGIRVLIKGHLRVTGCHLNALEDI